MASLLKNAFRLAGELGPVTRRLMEVAEEQNIPMARHVGRVIERAPKAIQGVHDPKYALGVGTPARQFVRGAHDYQVRMARLFEAESMGAGLVRGVDQGRVAFHDPFMRYIEYGGQHAVSEFASALEKVPVPEGLTRVFRGEGPRTPMLGSNIGQEDRFGQWYASTLNYGTQYAVHPKIFSQTQSGVNRPEVTELLRGFGHVRAVDVDMATVNATNVDPSKIGEEFLVPREAVARSFDVTDPTLPNTSSIAPKRLDPQRQQLFANLAVNRRTSAARLAAQGKLTPGGPMTSPGEYRMRRERKAKFRRRLPRVEHSTARNGLGVHSSAPARFPENHSHGQGPLM